MLGFKDALPRTSLMSLGSQTKDLAKLVGVADKMTACGKKPSGQGILYTIPSTQSTFMCAQARGVEYDHADCAALQVAAACLSATNSFLWNGKGDLGSPGAVRTVY